MIFFQDMDLCFIQASLYSGYIYAGNKGADIDGLTAVSYVKNVFSGFAFYLVNGYARHRNLLCALCKNAPCAYRRAEK